MAARFDDTDRFVRHDNLLVPVGSVAITAPQPGEDPPDPTPSGDYSVDNGFSLSNYSEPLRTYIDQALQVVDAIHDSSDSNIWGKTMQEEADTGDIYDISRKLGTHMTAAGHLFFLTGAPALLTMFEDIFDHLVASATATDNYGAPRWPERQGSAEPVNSNAYILDEGIFTGPMGMLARILHESGSSKADDALLLAQQMWRRWTGWDGGSSLTGDGANFETGLREFTHLFSNQMRFGWHLYKITDNTNYLNGFEKCTEAMFDCIGTVQGTTVGGENIATWAHRPAGESSDGAQNIDYSAYTLPGLYESTLEGQLPGNWSWVTDEVLRGAHHYFLRDAVSQNGLRTGSLGECSSGCGATSVTIDMYGGGTRGIDPQNFETRKSLSFMQFFWPVGSHFNSANLGYFEDQSTAFSDPDYTRMIGAPLALVVANWPAS